MLELVRWLPDDSAFAASHRGGPRWRGWGTDRHLLKGIFDSIGINTTVTAKAAAGKKARSIKPPRPWPLPDQVKQQVKKPVMSLAQLANNINRPRRRR